MPIEGAGEISLTLDVVWDMGCGDHPNIIILSTGSNLAVPVYSNKYATKRNSNVITMRCFTL